MEFKPITREDKPLFDRYYGRGYYENVYTKNTLIKLVPFTLTNGITIKERAGLSDTRIITTSFFDFLF